MTDSRSYSLPSVGLAVDSTTYLPLQRLRAAEAELKVIAESLENFRSYLGGNANRAKLLGLRGDFNVVHIACHSDFEEIDPLLSRIYFADGPIYAYEILEIPFHPRVVILSACDTFVHERRPGDEIFGLVRPFLTRGAGGVIATLWKVADISTMDLMKRFYDNLKVYECDLPTCIRNTQLETLKLDRYSHPYYWAPYYCIGSHPHA
jgi:CHAT domain-containing protein